MPLSREVFVLLTLVAVALLLALPFRPWRLDRPAGKLLLLAVMLVFPLLVTGQAASLQMQSARSTDFCLSCHIMEPYGESLHLDDTEYLPAGHYQNRQVPRQTACFACHTEYTLFGDARAKLKGFRHLWVYYAGTPPETIELYEPYRNRECLHCHAGARGFEEDESHTERRDELDSDETSCMECHKWVHGVDELEELERWREAAG